MNTKDTINAIKMLCKLNLYALINVLNLKSPSVHTKFLVAYNTEIPKTKDMKRATGNVNTPALNKTPCVSVNALLVASIIVG